MQNNSISLNQAKLNFERVLKERLQSASRLILKEGFNIKDAAKSAGVPETTLRRHLGLTKR